MGKWELHDQENLRKLRCSNPVWFAKYYTKEGVYTAQSLQAGYRELYLCQGHEESKSNIQLFYRDGKYHVRGMFSGDTFWENFDTLKRARKYLHKIIKEGNYIPVKFNRHQCRNCRTSTNI